jgi:hypothetical protein
MAHSSGLDRLPIDADPLHRHRHAGLTGLLTDVWSLTSNTTISCVLIQAEHPLRVLATDTTRRTPASIGAASGRHRLKTAAGRAAKDAPETAERAPFATAAARVLLGLASPRRRITRASLTQPTLSTERDPT